jgi:uncharacterized repeat protein (TIGR04052 family)
MPIMKTQTRFLIPFVLLLLAACTPNASDPTAAPIAPAAAGQPVTLRFAATVGDEIALCGETYAGIGTDDATVSFNDYRLYVSNIHLLAADGSAVPLVLEQDGLWQVDDVALLDFEDGSAGCATTGNAPLNGVVRGTAPEGDYTGVRFDLGVPFALNHQDVTSAPSPLNIAAMWWNWQGGYKFIRVDVETDAPENSGWNVHLGSTGCVSAAGAVPPAGPCSRPNVATFTFDGFDFADDVIVADLGGLLAGVPLYENTLMPPGCMSAVDDPDCPALFDGFGLSLEAGTCPDRDCSAQTFFRTAKATDVTPVTRTEEAASGA